MCNYQNKSNSAEYIQKCYNAISLQLFCSLYFSSLCMFSNHTMSLTRNQAVRISGIETYLDMTTLEGADTCIVNLLRLIKLPGREKGKTSSVLYYSCSSPIPFPASACERRPEFSISTSGAPLRCT